MRIRTIKPEFWRDEKLSSLGREVHDFAARLISNSDDEGYFRSHPALIAGDVYPFDSDAQRFIKKSLPELERIGFIELYEGGIGWLPGFTKHQRISKPTKSLLKDKKGQRRGNTKVREDSAPTPQPLREDSSTTPGGLRNHSATEVEVEVEVEHGSGTGNGAAPDKPATAAPAPEDLQRAWNAEADKALPRCQKLTPARRKSSEARLLEHGLPLMRQVIARISTSDFCRGIGRPESNPWVATFDWLLQPDVPVKVLEGKYDNRGPPVKGRADPNDGIIMRPAPVRPCAACGAPAVEMATNDFWACASCAGQFREWWQSQGIEKPWEHVGVWAAQQRESAGAVWAVEK